MSDAPSSTDLSMPGFAMLWNELVRSAAGGVPENVWQELEDACAFDGRDLEAAVARGIGKARSEGLKLPRRAVRVLEAGAAFLISQYKLVALVQLSQRFGQHEVARRDEKMATLLLDSWWVALDREIEATCNLVKAVETIVGRSETYRQVVEEATAWAKERKGYLAKQRNVVTHANTHDVTAIDDDGLWEPMIALKNAGVDVIADLASGQFERDNEAFEQRAGILRTVTTLAISQGDQYLKRAGQLIQEPEEQGSAP